MDMEEFMEKRKIKVQRTNGEIEDDWYYVMTIPRSHNIEECKKECKDDLFLVSNAFYQKYITRENFYKLNPDFSLQK